MTQRRAELTLPVTLAVAAVVAVADGVRTAHREGAAIGAVEAGSYVVLLGLALLALTVAYALRPREARQGVTGPGDIRPPLAAFALFAGYAAAVAYLGYLLASALFFAVYLRGFGSYRWIPVVVTSALVAAGSAYLWSELGMALPAGVLPWP